MYIVCTSPFFRKSTFVGENIPHHEHKNYIDLLDISRKMCKYSNSLSPSSLPMHNIICLYNPEPKNTQNIKVHMNITKYTPFQDIYYKKLYSMYAVIESNQHYNSSHFKSTF